MATLMTLTGGLLRAPERLLLDGDATAQDEGERLAVLAPRLLALIGLGAGAFGMVLGSYRGDLQYVYAAVKAPALLLLPVLVGLPAIRSFYAACELSVSWSRLALAALLATARTAVLAAALAPVLWLYLSLNPDYHSAVLAMAGSLLAVGVPGLWTLARSMPEGGRNRGLATLASVAVLGVLLAQSGWLLRPFIARPNAELTFLRPVEADVFSSLAATRRSAQGRYDRSWTVDDGGLLGRRNRPVEPPPSPSTRSLGLGDTPDFEVAPDFQTAAEFAPLSDFEAPADFTTDFISGPDIVVPPELAESSPREADARQQGGSPP